ncbi:uncharacterized protein LOC135100622 [Scylla paramamosain]|uniref:uncharacterized protein LOC135100622 n=1 Tax=Scylla paramamosain TaxID=85552 RepID=UPI0030829BAD
MLRAWGRGGHSAPLHCVRQEESGMAGVKCVASTSPSYEQPAGISINTCFCNIGIWLSNSAVTLGLTYSIAIGESSFTRKRGRASRPSSLQALQEVLSIVRTKQRAWYKSFHCNQGRVKLQ